MLQRFSPTSALQTTEGEHGFDLREILNFLWRQWKFIAAIAGATLLVAAVLLARETPRYTASAQVLLDPRKEKVAGNEAILSDVNLDFAVIESQMAIIRSTVFMRRVVEKEGLVSDPEFGSGPPQGSSLVETVRSYFFGAAEESTQKYNEQSNQAIPANIVGSVEALKGATSVTRAGQGYLLSISVTSVDPTRAAKLANAVADAYVVDKLDARFEAAQRASAWLSDRLTDLRKQLRESEEAVAQFRSGPRPLANFQCYLEPATTFGTQWEVGDCES